MPENPTVITYYPIESWPWSSILWNQNWPSPIPNYPPRPGRRRGGAAEVRRGAEGGQGREQLRRARRLRLLSGRQPADQLPVFRIDLKKSNCI